MSTVSLEHLETEHSKLGKLIEQFKQQSAPHASTEILIEEVSITLKAGERYAGAVLDDAGRVKHHLILLADRPEADVNWVAAKAWAEEVGGVLPDRQDQALLFANCKAALPQRWCWSSEPEGSSCAWYCGFGNGSQSYYHQSSDGSAVAVHRIRPVRTPGPSFTKAFRRHQP